MEDWLADVTVDVSLPVLEYRCEAPVLTAFSDVVRQNNTPLPFPDGHFAFAVSTQIFLKNTAVADIVAELKELIRVARQVRLAPQILDQQTISTLWGPVMLALQAENVGVEMVSVPCDAGPAVMLKLWAQQCSLT